MKKKLKTTKFRYLEKKEIKQPLHYLHDFYRLDVSYEDWRMDVELLLLSGLDGRLKRVGFEYGFIGQRLMKHIEIAYVLYVQGNIKDCVHFQRHLTTIEGMYSVLRQRKVYQSTEALLLFFKDQSLSDWIEQVEWLVNYASIGLTKYEHVPNDDSLFVYSRMMALVDSLYHIYSNDGMEMDLLDASLKRKRGN